MSSTRGPKGPRSTCPACGGRAWYDPAAQIVKCLGPVASWETVPQGRRPVYGRPCGWSELAPAGCCGDGVNRHGGEAGGGLEV